MRLVVADDLRRSRLTVFFRLLLALPHLFWLSAWGFVIAFLWLAAWVTGIATGRIPTGLHEMFGMYVRYATHVYAYVGLAANPFPGFLGNREYPVDLVLPAQLERQSRWSIGFRFLLVLPGFLLAAAVGLGLAGSSYGGAAAVAAFLGWFAALAVGRMPLGLRDLAAYGIGYTAQAYAYGLFLTDRYPDSDPEAAGPAWALPPHPVALTAEDDGRRSRLTSFFRLLLVLPHLFWFVLWTVAVLFAALANWLVALVRGRSASPLHRFLAAYVRYTTQVYAFAFLVANPFPGFVGARTYPVDVDVAAPERQSRWKTLFRGLLAIPGAIVAATLEAVLYVAGFLAWFVAVVRGRMPEGLRKLGAYCLRYRAQWLAYALVLTDRYPHASPALRPPPPPAPPPLPRAGWPEDTF